MRLYAITYRDNTHPDESEQRVCEYYSTKANALTSYKAHLEQYSNEYQCRMFLALVAIYIKPGKNNLLNWLNTWDGLSKQFQYEGPFWSVKQLRSTT